MKKRFFVPWLSVILASLMAFLSPMQIIAKGAMKYIEDVVIVAAKSYSDADAFLGSDYYVLNTPIYDGGDTTNGRVNKSWLAYKVTTDPTKALTDLRAMRMNDPWDYQAYNDYLKQLKTETEAEVDALADAVYEFQNNLAEGKEKAQYVYNVLQYLCDDEPNKYEDEEAEEPDTYLPYKRLGDLFYDLDFEDEDSSAKNDLAGILLKSNAQCINIIYNALTLACSETKENNFLDVISLSSFNPGIYKNRSEFNSAAQDIIDTLSITQSELKKYEETEKKYGSSGILTLPEKDKAVYEDTLRGIEYILDTDARGGKGVSVRKVLESYSSSSDGTLLYDMSYEEKRLTAETILIDVAWYTIDEGLENLSKVIKRQDHSETYVVDGKVVEREIQNLLRQIADISNGLGFPEYRTDYFATIQRNKERYQREGLEIPEVLKNLTALYENDSACYEEYPLAMAEIKSGKRLYEILKSCEYHGYNGEYQNLYDLVMAHDMTVPEEKRDGSYDPSDFYPIIAQLSDGQRAMLKSGILNLVLSARVEAKEYTDSFETLKKLIEYAANGEYAAATAEDGNPCYSVYAGVDPEIFKEDSGIAMTKSAVERSYTYDAKANHLSPILSTVMLAAGATAAVTATSMVIALGFLDHVNTIWNEGQALTAKLDSYVKYFNSNGFMGESYIDVNNAVYLRQSIASTAAKVFAGITAIAMIVIAVVGLVKATIKIWARTEDSDYLEIPHMVCTEADITAYTVNLDGGLTFYDTTDYVYYYGVTNPTIGLTVSGIQVAPATDPSYNDLSKYKIADVANWSLSGDRQWIALYYTKAPGIGQPILDGSLSVSENAIETGKNTVCRFDGTDACDMQEFLAGKKVSKYIHYAVDKTYDPFTTVKEMAGLTGSVFAKPSTYVFGGMTLLLGAAAGCGITAGVNKKKKKDA